MLELDINCEVVNHPIDSKRYWAADWHVKMYMSSGRLPCQSKVRELEILHYRLVWQGWHKNRNKRTTSLLKKKHFENHHTFLIPQIQPPGKVVMGIFRRLLWSLLILPPMTVPLVIFLCSLVGVKIEADRGRMDKDLNRNTDGETGSKWTMFLILRMCYKSRKSGLIKRRLLNPLTARQRMRKGIDTDFLLISPLLFQIPAEF